MTNAIVPPKRTSGFWYRTKTLILGFGLLCLSLLAGIEAGLIQYGIRRMGYQLNSYLDSLDPGTRILNISSFLAAISVVLLLALAVFTPAFWRRVRGIGSQRAVVYTTVQVFGISIGLFGLNAWFSFSLTTLTVFAGTRIWWHWERRWRGVGRSPSIRSGIMRPTIHPGQIWFAFVKGEKETKNRPVITLHATDNGRWLVAYYTSRPPRYEAQKKYFFEVPADTVRGIEKDSWINLADVRALKRNQFRTYIGLAPRSVYEDVCEGASVTPDPMSWTIPENSAGESYGPVESEFRRILGLDYNDEPGRAVENVLDIFKGFITWLSNKGKH